MSETVEFVVRHGIETTIMDRADFMNSNDLTIGQIFFAVANHFEKHRSKYDNWPSPSKNPKGWSALEKSFSEMNNDWEKMVAAMEMLGENLNN